MSAQAEAAFARTYVTTISSQPVQFGDDFQQAPEETLKKVPVVPVELPPVPKRVQSQPSASSAASFTVTFKSSKPPASYTLSIFPTDTISHVKSLLHTTHAGAPPADGQRLLLKGKALTDNKLVQEYSVKEGDTINLMLKPGFEWDPTSSPAPTPPPILSASPPSPTLGPTGPRKHGRTPSIVLSPSPSSENLAEIPADITLSLAGEEGQPIIDAETPYRETLSKPSFWEGMLAFLRPQFITEADALLAFEDFLAAAKGSLTASQIAKIRDECGVVGMAGT